MVPRPVGAHRRSRGLPGDLDCLVATGWQTSFRVATLPARRRFYFVQSDETRFHPAGSPWEHITRLSYMLDLDFLTEARWIKRWLWESFGRDAELVPNGLDETVFFPSEPLEPRGRRPRVLIEGAINLPYKGMAEAYAAVADEDVEIWIVSSLGRPPKHWRCDRFFEQVPMSLMRRIYSSCDILLKLSRVEGFFGPPMEMMACGGAVVVGRVSGYDEYIDDGANALVVDVDRPEEATAAVRRLVRDPGLRASLIQAGLRTAREWRWEPSIDILERFYLDVVDGRRGVPPSPASLDRSFSIAYFYGLLRGEVWEDLKGAQATPGEEWHSVNACPSQRGATLCRRRGSDAAIPHQRLLHRLRQERSFRALATLVYRAYHAAKVILSGCAGDSGAVEVTSPRPGGWSSGSSLPSITAETGGAIHRFRRALVTGGAGFIGSHIVDALLDQDLEVTVLDDLSSGTRDNLPAGVGLIEADVASLGVVDLVAAARPDLVIHAAAQISVPASVLDPARDRDVNLVGTENILKGAQAARASRFVFISSGGAIYGAASGASEETVPAPRNPYGVHKLAAEAYVRLKHDATWNCALFERVWPSSASWSGGRRGGHLPGRRRGSRGRVTVFGDGRQSRDFVHVDDAVRATIAVAASDMVGT